APATSTPASAVALFFSPAMVTTCAGMVMTSSAVHWKLWAKARCVSQSCARQERRRAGAGTAIGRAAGRVSSSSAIACLISRAVARHGGALLARHVHGGELLAGQLVQKCRVVGQGDEVVAQR